MQKEKSRESYTKWHKRRNKNKMRLFNTFMAKSNQAGRQANTSEQQQQQTRRIKQQNNHLTWAKSKVTGQPIGK